MPNFKLDVDADGIALVTWDMTDRSMNVINGDVIEELGKLLDKITADAAIKGAVITSGKPTFCAGADLAMLEGMAAVYAGMMKKEGEEAAAGFWPRRKKAPVTTGALGRVGRTGRGADMTAGPPGGGRGG